MSLIVDNCHLNCVMQYIMLKLQYLIFTIFMLFIISGCSKTECRIINDLMLAKAISNYLSEHNINHKFKTISTNDNVSICYPEDKYIEVNRAVDYAETLYRGIAITVNSNQELVSLKQYLKDNDIEYTVHMSGDKALLVIHSYTDEQIKSNKQIIANWKRGKTGSE